MSAYDELVRPLLFALDPETVHNLGMQAIARGIVTGRRFDDRRLRLQCFGVDFANPIGLAAGFDKNAEAVDRWGDFGFGYAELGTVTRHAQPGNPKPRLFRVVEDQAIINRMGFNNDGADAVAARLERATPTIPIGVNLGKSKRTPLEDAPSDYAYSFRRLAPLASYVVVNVSSPNTPGLRTLQDKGPLTAILSGLRSMDASKPLFVKIAPDLEESALADVISVATECGLTGIIATNTTLRRDGLTHPIDQAGGLSGAPLRSRALDVLRFLRRESPASFVLIGVGGIFTAQDVRERMAAGADMVQMYSGWVYGGPECVADILAELVGAI